MATNLNILDHKIRKAICEEIDANDVYQMQIKDYSDLRSNPHEKCNYVGESTHMIDEAGKKGKKIPIVFDSVSEHEKFHHFNPLKQGLILTPRGNYVIRDKKQIVDINMNQRPRVIQGKHGSIPHLFSMPNTPQDLRNPVYKKRW